MSVQNVRPCPVCDGDEKNVVFRQTFDALSDGSLSEGYDVAVCRRCGFAFADRIPEQAVFDRYYAEMSKYEYEQRGGQESASDLARFEAIAEEVRPFIQAPNARILDLGCSNGRLLAVLREKGFANVTGLDPSPACARDARELYGIEVFTGSLANNDLPPEPFDLIIMIGVLEHIRDLSGTVAKVSRMLKPRGRVLLEVPDAIGFAAWPDAPYQQFSTEHVCFFSAVSLRNLMNRHGFSLVHDRTLARDQSASTVMPVVNAVYEKLAQVAPQLEPDLEMEPALRQYIKQSESIDRRIQSTIDSIVASQREILVWGVGTHTQRLLKTSHLAEANITAFVDSNVKYQSRELHGIPIISPEAVRQLSHPILISSRAFQVEICEQIISDLRYPNELLVLYSV